VLNTCQHKRASSETEGGNWRLLQKKKDKEIKRVYKGNSGRKRRREEEEDELRRRSPPKTKSK
jgi:hypothetical protein